MNKRLGIKIILDKSLRDHENENKENVVCLRV